MTEPHDSDTAQSSIALERFRFYEFEEVSGAD